MREKKRDSRPALLACPASMKIRKSGPGDESKDVLVGQILYYKIITFVFQNNSGKHLINLSGNLRGICITYYVVRITYYVVRITYYVVRSTYLVLCFELKGLLDCWGLWLVWLHRSICLALAGSLRSRQGRKRTNTRNFNCRRYLSHMNAVTGHRTRRLLANGFNR